MRQVGFGGAGVELSLRSRWFALTALILLPLSRRLRRGADADLCDVAALPPLAAPMFGLPAVEILGDAGVHDPVAKLEVVLVTSSCWSPSLSYSNSLVNLMQCSANCTKSSAARLAWDPNCRRRLPRIDSPRPHG